MYACFHCDVTVDVAVDKLNSLLKTSGWQYIVRLVWQVHALASSTRPERLSLYFRHNIALIDGVMNA